MEKHTHPPNTHTYAQISNEFKPLIHDIWNGITKLILKIPNSQTNLWKKIKISVYKSNFAMFKKGLVYYS